VTFLKALLFTVLVQPYLAGHLFAQPINTGVKDTVQRAFLSISLPPKHRLNLVSVNPVTIDGEILGRLAVYDDPVTTRSADQVELYNKRGDLLAVGWFDTFGIERLAVDRALVDDSDKLEGIFVVIVTGDVV
jgi:hypothetical protein